MPATARASNRRRPRPRVRAPTTARMKSVTPKQMSTVRTVPTASSARVMRNTQADWRSSRLMSSMANWQTRTSKRHQT